MQFNLRVFFFKKTYLETVEFIGYEKDRIVE